MVALVPLVGRVRGLHLLLFDLVRCVARFGSVRFGSFVLLLVRSAFVIFSFPIFFFPPFSPARPAHKTWWARALFRVRASPFSSFGQPRPTPHPPPAPPQMGRRTTPRLLSTVVSRLPSPPSRCRDVSLEGTTSPSSTSPASCRRASTLATCRSSPSRSSFSRVRRVFILPPRPVVSPRIPCSCLWRRLRPVLGRRRKRVCVVLRCVAAGSIGYYSCFWFITKIYGSIKVD